MFLIYIYLIIEESNTNPTILNNIHGEISILQNNKLDYVEPENIYINSNLEPKENSTHKYKLIKKNVNDKIIRIEFSSSSDNIKYRIYTDKINKLNSNSTLIVYEEKENLGKKNIDIKLDDSYDSFIFEVYSDKIEDNKNKLSYTLRYRANGGKKVFNNYKTIANTNGEFEIKIQKNDKFKNVELIIPSIQLSHSLLKVYSTYYLKIYKYDENDIMINNTISIVDGIEPYKTYEFKFDGEFYNKNIEIPNDNLYYITIIAITPDRELLSYKSFLIDKDGNQGIDWLFIIIIIIVVLFLILLILIIHCILRKRKNRIENSEMLLAPINNIENNLEEKD